MMKIFKFFFKLIFGRTTIFITSLLVQLIILFSFFIWYYEYIPYLWILSTILSFLVIISILNSESNPDFKMAWIIPILAIPIFGTLLYIILNFQLIPKLIGRQVKQNEEKSMRNLKQKEINFTDDRTKGFINYMNSNGFIIYENTKQEYFPLGEDKYVKLLEDLKKAKHFIFLEYFIISKGEMWNSILEILKEKVKSGVEVRVMYDGMCSIMLLPYNYPKELESYGIKCHIFNPIKAIISTYHNNRDHRKIVVIDGIIGYTGGVNLSDEYINKKECYGHWKDTAIRIEGEAVNSLTQMFLTLWNTGKVNNENFLNYKIEHKVDSDGYVMPYYDNPYDKKNIGKQVYMDIISRASKYLYITTPYLVLDYELLNALKYAANRGVKVKILLPHIPDKKYVYMLARVHYEELINDGIEIYEYKSGFIHAKMFISDDEIATIGTFNLDFRSLYLNFEDGIYLYKSKTINEMKKDFLNTINKSIKITKQNVKQYSKIKLFIGEILRLIAPLT